MFWHRDMAAAPWIPQVAGDALAAMEDFHGPVSDACVNHLPDQTERHGIPAAIHLDVIIRRNTGALPTRKDIGFCRQWLQVWAIECRKQIRPACPIIAHDTHVQCVQQRPDGGIQFCQREEPVIAQPREDPALGNLNGHLDLGFILGFSHARRHDRRAVMFRHFGIGPVQAGIIPVCLDHR